MRAWVSTVVSPMKGVWPDKRVRGLIYLCFPKHGEIEVYRCRSSGEPRHLWSFKMIHTVLSTLMEAVEGKVRGPPPPLFGTGA